MAPSSAAQRLALATTFADAACRYWLCVYPGICREARCLRSRAELIPDPELRRLALEAQHSKRGNIEGAAAFAAFAPRRYRGRVLRAQMAFQSIYDYVDTLAEQPSRDPVRNGYQLHQALLVALDRAAQHPDYYAFHPLRMDDGYLAEIVDACRDSLGALPSYPSIAAPARSLTRRIVAYQSYNLSEPQGGHRSLARWAQSETPCGTGLRWWETAASAGSSLGVFALISSAADAQVRPADAIAIEEAYWPWVGALHSLLDSVRDEREDVAARQCSLLHYYSSPQEAASRLKLLAAEALRCTAALPNPRQHALVLAGMASFYLSAPASSITSLLVSRSVLETLGDFAKPTMLVFGARRTVTRLTALARGGSA